MSTSTDQFYDDIRMDIDNIINFHSPINVDGSLAEFLEPFKITKDFATVSTFSSASINTRTQTPLDFSSDWNSISNDQDSSSAVQQSVDTFPLEIQSHSERLEIIEQPYQSSKLRYRTEYIKDKNRLGVLKNKNKKSEHRGPAVRIPQCYRNPSDEHYISVSLVTVKHKKTNLHYFHPYELENPCNEQLNDRQSNSVWFPIEQINSDGFISFPSLRIVKKKASELEQNGRLHPFDCHDLDQSLKNQSSRQLFLGEKTDIVREYNLERSQLAFTVGKKQTVNGQLSIVLYANTTVLSEEMCENVSKKFIRESESEPRNKNKPKSSSSDRLIYKYAPRCSFAESNEEVLVFLAEKINPTKYENLQVTVECDTSNGRWSQPVLDLEIKKRMISFKTPTFSHPMTKAMPVDIILRQKNRILGVLKYSYLPDCA